MNSRTSFLPLGNSAYAAFRNLSKLGLLAIVTSLSLSAATYYVDFAAGSNSNSGNAPTAPWKNAPGDSNATANPASTTLAPGDKVLFKGGVTYVGSIALKWSGSTSNPITLDGISWTGSRAIISNRNDSAGGAGISDSGASRSNIVIQGIHFHDIGGYAENSPVWATTTAIDAPPVGTGIGLSGESKNIVIENCHFSEIGQWQNKKPMSGPNSVTGAGVSLQNNSNILIASCDFTRMKTGVSIKATTTISNITIKGSTFHNYMNWLIDIAPRSIGATLRDITIDGCTLYDYKEFDSPNWQGYGEKPHQDGIFLRTAGMRSTWENIVIRNTRFYSDQTSNGGTASIYVSEGPSVDVYNCVFLNDIHSNAYVNVGFKKVPGMTQKIRIWNNTFVGGTRALKITPGNTNADTVEIRNNAFVRKASFDVIGIDPADIGSLIMDNNVYYGGDTGRAVHDGSRYLTLSAWKAQSGLDVHSTWAHVEFVSTSGPASTWNVRPASASSPLVGNGFNLSSFFTSAINALARPSSWDIGAFSFNTAAAGLVAPSNLRLESR